MQNLLLQCVTRAFPRTSHVLRRCPQQRLIFNRFVVVGIVKVGPEEVEPVTAMRFHCAEEVAFEKVDQIVPHTTVEGTFASLRDEVPIPGMKFVLVHTLCKAK